MNALMQTTQATPGYSGYLAKHLDQIVALHHAGNDARAIATALYRRGVRAGTTDFNTPRAAQERSRCINSLRILVLYILRRQGLRVRRHRPPRWPKTA